MLLPAPGVKCRTEDWECEWLTFSKLTKVGQGVNEMLLNRRVQGRIQFSLEFTGHLVFPCLREQFLPGEVLLHVSDRVVPLSGDAFLQSAISPSAGLCGVIAGVGLALNQRRSAAPPGPLERFVGHSIKGDDIVAIDGNASKTVAPGMAAQVLGFRLLFRAVRFFPRRALRHKENGQKLRPRESQSFIPRVDNI